MLILELKDLHLSDISFLERTKNIKKLILDRGLYSIKDFTFLSNLETLEYLFIDFGSKEIDISFLGGNKNIKELKINSEYTFDYSFLSTLEKLEFLFLESSKISDFSFMNKNIKKLTLIDCDEIKDYSFISYLENLESLYITRRYKDLNNFTNISFL